MNNRLSRSLRRWRWTSSKVYQCCRGKSHRHRSCCDFTSTAFFTSGLPGKAKYSRSDAGIAKRPLSSSLHGNSPANIAFPQSEKPLTLTLSRREREKKVAVKTTLPDHPPAHRSPDP